MDFLSHYIYINLKKIVIIQSITFGYNSVERYLVELLHKRIIQYINFVIQNTLSIYRINFHKASP